MARLSLTRYLVLWWMSQTPYAAVFKNKVAAEAAAHVRNGLMITMDGAPSAIVDYYRRDEAGNPMPAEFRDLEELKPHPMPWMPIMKGV